MGQASLEAREELLQQAAPAVRTILARKSGMSLAESDSRRDNVDAIELYHEVMARLWERLTLGADAAPTREISDFKAFAAVVARNAWADHLRAKYPRRASLKNRLRYFLGHQPKYAVWDDAAGETIAGFRKWLLAGRVPARIGRDARELKEKLPGGSVPRKAMEQFGADDWDRLLDAVFTCLAAPVALDDILARIAELIGLKEDRVDSLDEDWDQGSQTLTDSGASQPDRDAELRSALKQLWEAVCRLRPEYRCAYLLNIPGPGKSRGDIETFVFNGLTSVAGIGDLLALAEAQFQIAWSQLELSADDRSELETLNSPPEKFCLLWKYLPLEDGLIARMLGLERQQVINRRMLALRELARSLRAG